MVSVVPLVCFDFFVQLQKFRIIFFLIYVGAGLEMRAFEEPSAEFAIVIAVDVY